VTFAVHVLHNPARLERRLAVAALQERLGDRITVEIGPGPENEFNERRWRRALAHGGDHAVFVDDDVIVCEDFKERAARVIEAQLGEVFALHTCLPQARAAYSRGERWLTSDDGVIGPAYVVPIPVLREFLVWRSSALKSGAIEASGQFGSDVLLGMFCSATKRKVYHPIPTLTRHDLSLETNFPGNESTPGRQTTCSFADVPLPDSWEQTTPIEHVGSWYKGMPELKQAWLKDCPKCETRARRSLFIAVPVYKSKYRAFEESLSGTVATLQKLGIPHTVCELWGDSLITRARNMLVRSFLESGCTDMLFLDADLQFHASDVVRLFLSGHKLCGAPYPAKTEGGFLIGNPLVVDGMVETRDGWAKAQDIPTGFMLVAREVFEAVSKHTDEVDDDVIGGNGRPYRIFFDTGVQGRQYLSEDWLFTRFARLAGFEPWLDMKAKIRHWGDYGYKGPSLEERLAAAATTPEDIPHAEAVESMAAIMERQAGYHQ
jgi:hypothetical protein